MERKENPTHPANLGVGEKTPYGEISPRRPIGEGSPQAGDRDRLPEQLFSRPLKDGEIVRVFPEVLKKVHIDPRGVKVRFEADKMVLFGTVADKRSRRIAEEIGARMAGSRALENELVVRSTEGKSRTRGPV